MGKRNGCRRAPGLWLAGPILAALLGPGHAAAVEVTYAPSHADFANPERGFYQQHAPIWIGGERLPLDPRELASLRERGVSMLRLYFVLDRHRADRLPEDVLAYIGAELDKVRDAGLKAIPRFAYNFPTNDDYTRSLDAPQGVVRAHLDQLAPVLRARAGIVAFMEAGFVGAWGEWHSSSNRLVDDETGVTPASRAIVAQLLAILPRTRMVALRYPRHKRQLFGGRALVAASGHGGTARARVGAHNDCVLAADDDWGTYPDDPVAREATKAWLALDNRFVPQGGETCNATGNAGRIACSTALAELRRLRYSTLNRGYHPDVLATWERQGCLDRIRRELGYRLRLISAAAPWRVRRGGNLALDLRLINIGYAAPYNPRGLEVVLRPRRGGPGRRVDVGAQADPRRWLPDLGAFALPLRVPLPADLAPGAYDLLLALPDPVPTLRPRPAYAIRFANAGLWEPRTGFNRLKLTVNIK